jgi:hypothetical protein
MGIPHHGNSLFNDNDSIMDIFFIKELNHEYLKNLALFPNNLFFNIQIC